MNLKIEDINRFSEGTKRAIHRECKVALGHLKKKEDGNPHETVHETRKSFKKIRALLRLVRNNMTEYQTENVFFRDQGRKISDLRDATAIIEALDIINKQHSDKLYKRAFAELRKDLMKRRDDITDKALNKGKLLQEIERNITKKCHKIGDIAIHVDSYQSVAPNIKRVYKRGKKAYKAAAISKRTDDFHEWRKRIKYLRYQLLAIHGAWPKLLTTWENELHKLSDYLGSDRDLFMLHNHLLENRVIQQEQEYYLLRTLIKGHRLQLQERALLLCKRLYHLGPSDFVSLIVMSMDAQVDERKLNLIPPSHLES